MFYNFVQGVGTYEAFGRSRIDKDAMHLGTLYEMERVKSVLVPLVVNEVCIVVCIVTGISAKVCVVLLGVGVDVVVRSLFMGNGLRLRA